MILPYIHIMGGNYRKGMTKIVYYFHIKISLANGQTVEGIREYDTQKIDLVERIYRHKAELHYKHTHLTEIKVTELASQSLAVKLYREKQKKNLN